jgi:Ser-tRNA(Ala) deacylase AlaX
MEKKTDPRMHSAEHLLNQTMIRMFDCGRCFSAHIEKKKSKCDYHFDRALTQREIHEIEARMNGAILKDMRVAEAYMTKQEAEKHFSLARVPPAAGERIRIIRIGDYDACPCIGPHVDSTKKIGRFKISSTDFDSGVLRIRFKLIDWRSD